MVVIDIYRLGSGGLMDDVCEAGVLNMTPILMQMNGCHEDVEASLMGVIEYSTS